MYGNYISPGTQWHYIGNAHEKGEFGGCTITGYHGEAMVGRRKNNSVSLLLMPKSFLPVRKPTLC